jgi:hypothetical protein
VAVVNHGFLALLTLNTVDKNMLTDEEIAKLNLQLISQDILGYQDDLRIIEENYLAPDGRVFWRIIYTY